MLIKTEEHSHMYEERESSVDEKITKKMSITVFRALF